MKREIEGTKKLKGRYKMEHGGARLITLALEAKRPSGFLKPMVRIKCDK